MNQLFVCKMISASQLYLFAANNLFTLSHLLISLKRSMSIFINGTLHISHDIFYSWRRVNGTYIQLEF